MAGVVAAEPPLPAHASFTIDSAVLKEVRRINVYTPPGHDRESRAGYPVLYMPDGGLQEDFPHAVRAVSAEVKSPLL
jgi:predicted alpha/beta superfamily hydrolase